MRASRVTLDRAALDRVADAIDAGALAVGERIRAEAALRMPRRTGETAESGRVEQTSEGVVVSFGGAARYLETGTADTAAQPSLAPAMTSVAGQAPAIMRDTVGGRLR